MASKVPDPIALVDHRLPFAVAICLATRQLFLLDCPWAIESPFLIV